MPWLVLLVLCVACALEVSPQDFPVVSTPLGSLRGSVMKSLFKRDIFSFRGVRYAQPPIGPLRFKPPEPLEPWVGVVDATEDSVSCPQPDFSREMSEDCLFLNVFSTQLPGDGSEKRPVFVWIHGGGWQQEAGTSDKYGPEYLMDQDIVLITCNSRLGILGFLSTGDAVLPGNYGMKDQVAALRWVQQNIAAFGGDPDQVTLGGNSAGAANVWFHLLSPMATGLFHRAIVESPTINTMCNLQLDPLLHARHFGALLNCPTETSQTIFNCINEKSVHEILDVFGGYKGWDSNISFIFIPVMERPEAGVEGFIVSDPKASLLAGNFSKVPLMMGITKDEFSYRAWDVFKNLTWVRDMDENWEDVAPIVFMYEQGTDFSHRVSQRLRETYLQGLPLTDSLLPGLGKLYADAYVIFWTDRTAKLVSAVSPHPVFYYRFSYQGRFSYCNIGVCHRDDVIYLLPNSLKIPMFKPDDPDVLMVQLMTTMWANFITTGNPTSAGVKTDWLPLTPDNLQYLDIGPELVMQRDLYQDRIAIWEDLFPL